MAEKVGLIKDIKLGTWLAGSPLAFDICIVTIKEATGASWSMFLWNNQATAPGVERILQTQRLALAREAALRGLQVHLWHLNDSSIIDQIKVDFP